jgi:hypothetical protein
MAAIAISVEVPGTTMAARKRLQCLAHQLGAGGPRDPPASASPAPAAGMVVSLDGKVGLYPIVTSQYSSTTFYQASYHIQ